MGTREEYVQKMKAQLDEINGEIDALEAKLSSATAPAREKLNEQLAKAREGYGAVADKLGEIRESGEDAFERRKDEAEHLWKVLRQSVKYFRSQL